jgi:hypothetical protein
MSKSADLIGKVFGRLTVMAQCSTCKRKSWECRCFCGKYCTVRDDCLKDGNTQSCGCLRIERASAAVRTHGRYDTPEYVCWVNMLQRCTNTKHKHYSEYGGRGITVSPSWLFFENFYADMGNRPSKLHSLDRKDNDGPYCKDNCRWASQKQQMNNTRSVKYITYGGETRTISEWAEHLYMQVETLRTRLKLGWSIQDALTTPVKSRNKQ